jgi:hypothetical protein
MGTIYRLGRIALFFGLLSLVASVAATTGTIQVFVHPGSGTVCLDTACKMNQGTIDGTGSTTFDGVEAGRYHMLNVYGTEGYEPYLKQIYLDPSGASLTRDIYLDKAPVSPAETGSIQVFITPDGGEVCLDRQCDVSVGDSTGSWSVQFTDVTANTYHTLTLTHPGYETYSTQVRLLPDQASTMDISLKRLPPGSTPIATPPPLQATPAPLPTKAGLPWILALAATGICGLGWVNRKSKR